MNTGLLFDIKHYAIHDGPGIRITLFMKGCPLACKWCHNPESKSPKVQKMYTQSKCIGAQDCVENCPNDALTLTQDGIVTDTSLCALCGKCAEVCPTKAIEMSGDLYSAQKIMDIIEKDRLILDQSQGGVTFSGGEPLMHSSFLFKLLDACGEKNLHRTVDTTGFANKQVIFEVAERTDLFLYDLKIMDSDKHLQWTGVRNERILENLQLLSGLGANIIIRIPIIKGVNEDWENIEQTARFVAALEGEPKTIHLLPYHDIAKGKHQKLGTEYKTDGMEEPSKGILDRILDQFANHGLTATIGG